MCKARDNWVVWVLSANGATVWSPYKLVCVFWCFWPPCSTARISKYNMVRHRHNRQETGCRPDFDLSYRALSSLNRFQTSQGQRHTVDICQHNIKADCSCSAMLGMTNSVGWRSQPLQHSWNEMKMRHVAAICNIYELKSHFSQYAQAYRWNGKAVLKWACYYETSNSSVKTWHFRKVIYVFSICVCAYKLAHLQSIIIILID